MRSSSLTIIALLAILTPLGARAIAQDAAPPSPPSAEEVALRREIASLRDRLARAEERIRQLEAERDALRAQLAEARKGAQSAAGGESQAPSEELAPVPDDPFASPASMLQELRKRYEIEFAGLPHDTDPAIEAYKRDVQVWCRNVSRELRGRGQWVVQVLKLEEIPHDRRSFEALLRVIDPASGLPIGRPFLATIDASDARQIERLKDRFHYWKASVVVVAAPRYNEQRVDEGVFEHPPFVGRYCDFGVDLDFKRFVGVPDDQIGKGAPSTPARGR